MKPGISEHDDLTRIKGIGDARQKWLNNVLELYTFAALASASPDELERHLKEEGHIISHSVIQGWIDQAKQLAETMPADMSDDATETTLSESLLPAAESKWKPFASFVVEFQTCTGEVGVAAYRTVVHHMESDTGTLWPGLKDGEIYQWMRQRIEDKLIPPQEAAKAIQAEKARSAPAASIPTRQAEVAITSVRTFQPADAAIPLPAQAPRSLPSILKSGEPFMLEVDLDMMGEIGPELSGPELEYSGQLQARNLSNGRRTQLTMIPAPPKGQQRAHQLRLSDTSLAPGVYKMGILVTLKGVVSGANYIELPLVQVV